MTTERIDRCFARLRGQQKTALVAYLTIGDPSVDASIACALAALEAGADILELGVPFSDPTADGPVIAAAAHRAIGQGGSLRAALRVASAVRDKSDAPLVLFSYVNPIVAFGEAELPRAVVDAGADGLLVVDLPPEEGRELRDAADAAALSIIPLVAPTTDREREARVLSRASGFIYSVSLTGVTGSKQAPLAAAGKRAHELRARAGLPVVVGFGIDSAEKAHSVAAAGVDGVVVGTAIVKAIAASSDPPGAVRDLVGELRRGLDAT